jgi:hypothetical protein
MTRPFVYGRRAVVSAAGGAVIAQIAACLPFFKAFARAEKTSSVDAIVSACRALNCPATLAKACRRSVGEDLAPGDLVHALRRDLALGAGDRSSTESIWRALRDQSRRDFASGRIQTVEGWIFSVTEVRAYALAAPY